MRILILTIIFFSTCFGLKAQNKVEIKTSAICEMCQYTIEKEMALEKGVKSASLNLENKLLTVSFNPKKTDIETIRKRISLTGYHADTVRRDSVAYTKLPLCCQDGAHGTSKQEPHRSE